MAVIELDLTVTLFGDELEIWHNYDSDCEEPESTTTLADLFDGYAEDLKGGFGYEEAKRYVVETFRALEEGKTLLLNTLDEMKGRS